MPETMPETMPDGTIARALAPRTDPPRGRMYDSVINTVGTLTGIARTLRPRSPDLRIVGMEPAESVVLSGDEAGPHGIQGIDAGFRPAVLDMALLDEVVPVSEGHALARRPALQGRLVVGIAASFAERYLSTDLFAEL